MRSTIFGLVVIGAGLLAPPSRACSRFVPSPVLTEPVFDSPAIVVESTHLGMTCRSLAAHARCELDIRYSVRNRQPEVVETRAVFHAAHLVPVVREDAGGAGSTITTLALRAAPAVERARESLNAEEALGVEESYAFELTFGAREVDDVVVHAAFDMPLFVETFGADCARAGIRERHPIVARGQPHGTYAVRYFIASADGWVDAQVHHPSEWNGSIRLSRGDDERRVVEGAIAGTELARLPAEEATVLFEMEVPRSIVWNGGPFVGVGWGFAHDPGVRLRVGYEIAAPFWLAHAIALESDLSRALTFVPSSEVVTKGSLAASFGAGVPVQVRPYQRTGGRVQIGAGHGPFSVRAALDVFTTRIEGSILGQVSF